MKIADMIRMYLFSSALMKANGKYKGHFNALYTML